MNTEEKFDAAMIAEGWEYVYSTRIDAYKKGDIIVTRNDARQFFVEHNNVNRLYSNLLLEKFR